MMYDTWKRIEEGISISSRSLQMLGVLKWLVMEQKIDEAQAKTLYKSAIRQIREEWDNLYRKDEKA